MKYVIYKMINPSHLKEVEQEGYGYTKTIYRSVLEKLDIPHVEETHTSIESAMAEITAKKNELKHLTLTIIPVIEITWDGEIR